MFYLTAKLQRYCILKFENKITLSLIENMKITKMSSFNRSSKPEYLPYQTLGNVT